MNTLARLVNYYFLFSSVSIFAIPPEVCFANFRWDDCGKPPVPVMYYYKPGSRCEVAMWRGCLPNPNMFPDEYSCINTCIFVKRSDVRDYDQFRAEHLKGIDSREEEDVDVTEETTSADGGNGTDVSDAGNGNVTESGTTVAEGNDAKGNDTGGQEVTNSATDAPPPAPE